MNGVFGNQAAALVWACDTIDRLVGESLTKLNVNGRVKLEEARYLAAVASGVHHSSTTEWVGFPMRICEVCMVEWPCDFAPSEVQS